MHLDQIGAEIAQIPVSINYDIISLFSEGLYKSPHKAVEELVSNSYDADARRVHVLLPEAGDETGPRDPLWVIDDGHGMDVDGFRQLWRVADSTKKNAPSAPGRAPIGQFGIGKLASYVLAWKLTHISRVAGRLLLTVMDFHKCTGRRQYDNASPVEITLREVDETTAKSHLWEIDQRDPSAWGMMFGKNRSSSWTAAGLSDFKDLYSKLATGTLRWVLSTGLPLLSNFEVYLNGNRVAPSKETGKLIKQFPISGSLPVIGSVNGTARIYEQQLTTGKSEQMGRSNGFFVRVRGRVINLEDELFGIEAVNHAAWSRFALEVHADGLLDYLLSSREGVRDCDEIQAFRELLLEKFNDCRSAFEKWSHRNNEQLEMDALLSSGHSIHITEPLMRSVRNTVESGTDSFYIDVPSNVERERRHEWFATYKSEASKRPIDKSAFKSQGPSAPALRYDPVSRLLVVNLDHPFVDKLTAGGKRLNPAKLFATSEVFLEGQLQGQGISPVTINSFLRDRDRVLRLMAGDAPPTATRCCAVLPPPVITTSLSNGRSARSSTCWVSSTNATVETDRVRMGYCMPVLGAASVSRQTTASFTMRSRPTSRRYRRAEWTLPVSTSFVRRKELISGFSSLPHMTRKKTPMERSTERSCREAISLHCLRSSICGGWCGCTIVRE